MDISKIKAAWAFLTGGWSGLAEYLLTAVNKGLAMCDTAKLRKTATIAISIAAVVKTACDVFAPEKYKAAATKTVEALEAMATELEDGNLTADEITANISAIAACIDGWKEVK